MNSARFVGTLSLCLLGMNACGLAGPDCTPAPSPAIVVEVVDSVTNAFIAQGASGVVRDGVFQANLHAGNIAPGGELAALEGAEGRPGTYAVTITKPGYRDWTMTNVRVNNGRCGVETRLLRARLQVSG